MGELPKTTLGSLEKTFEKSLDINAIQIKKGINNMHKKLRTFRTFNIVFACEN